MNPTSNPQGEPSWVSHDTWEHTAANSTSQYQGSASSRPPEWDWDNQMLLMPQSSPEVAADRKPQIVTSLPTATICNRPYSSNYAAAIPQSFIHHQQQEHHTGVVDPPFNVPSRSSYAGLEGHHYHHQSALLQTGLVSSLGQQQAGGGGGGEGGAPSNSTDLNAEMRSYEQRRRFLGMHMLDPDHSRNLLDFVKREDMYSLGEHARIGLNLGGRTYFSAEDSARFGKRTRLNSITHAPICQVQGCTADLGKAKHYHRRHKVCEIHSKASNVIANGQTQRFCQQCSRFHQLSEFDDTKRSCRKRLADHNRRRRKPQASAVVTVSETYKAEDQSTNIRQTEGDHKPVLLHIQKTGSPTASKDSISTGGNKLLQNQSPTYGPVDEKQLVSRESLLRNRHALPSSHVQALVLSVVSRTPSSAPQLTNRPATQESVYQQYLQGPSLSLSSAGVSSQTTHNNTAHSSQNYSSMEQQSIAWLGTNTGSRSPLLHTRPLQTQQSQAFSSKETRPRQLQGSTSNTHPHLLLHNVTKSSDWLVENMPRSEQLGRLGLQGVQAGSMDGRPMLALIENPSQQQHQQHQQPTVHDIKPLQQQSEMQHSVRSSFGSSFYDSSSSIG